MWTSEQFPEEVPGGVTRAFSLPTLLGFQKWQPPARTNRFVQCFLMLICRAKRDIQRNKGTEVIILLEMKRKTVLSLSARCLALLWLSQAPSLLSHSSPERVNRAWSPLSGKLPSWINCCVVSEFIGEFAVLASAWTGIIQSLLITLEDKASSTFSREERNF